LRWRYGKGELKGGGGGKKKIGSLKGWGDKKKNRERKKKSHFSGKIKKLFREKRKSIG